MVILVPILASVLIVVIFKLVLLLAIVLPSKDSKEILLFLNTLSRDSRKLKH